MNEFEPKQFGKYYLIEKLAVGGMAEIYKAKTFGVDGFEKEVAIKRILPHCSADKDFITMLIDEAKLSVVLSHANIVQVYDLGKVGEDYFISMEFIHGVNLRDIMYRCREGKIPMPIDIAVYIISEICKGLDYAHRKTDANNSPLNIVHRDVSPQNVLISYEGEVKIVDFGIAKAAMNISHTMAGILKGKIAYMSPEQAMGKSIDRRTDIFSAGILLYETVTGAKLYTGESQFEVLKKIRTTRITAETLPDSVPEPLKPAVAKALAHNVDNRYQNAGDLQIDLTKYLYSTYSDFSPRKLAAFIREIFNVELKGEQVTRARESAFEQQTSSMSTAEGAKQMEIVHREVSYPPRDETARAKGPAEAFLETVVAPGERRVAGAPAREVPTVSAVKKKRRALPRAAIAMLVLAAVGYAAYRYVPAIRLMISPPPSPPPAEEAIGSARVVSEPAGGKIFIDDKDTGMVTPAVILDLAIGSHHTIRVEKEGLNPAEKRITVASAEPVDVVLTLPELTGVLNVITDPGGAAIMVEGRFTGRATPATIENLPLGKDLRIAISKPDFEDFEQVVNLTSPKPQKISTKLKPIIAQSGKLVITSTPSGASVSLNGKDTGRTTPATMANLEPKKYTVALAMTGYEGWTGNFDVGADQSVPVDTTLLKSAAGKPAAEKPITEGGAPAEKPAGEKGALKVTSAPEGANILLDGRPTGRKTPATLPDLKIGSTYAVRLDLDGYKSTVKKKQLKKDSETLYAALTKEEVQPPPPAGAIPPAVPPTPPPAPPPAPPAKEEVVLDTGKPGTIKIASNPSGADVFINSEHKGRTPLTVSVQPGTVSVLVSKEGAGRVSRQVTVRPGQTVSLTDLNVGIGELYGEVSLTSDPPRAQVTFDGQTIPAPTPVTVRKVRRDQQHSVTVSLPGYRPWSRSFSMDEGAKSFHVTLESQ